MVIEEKDLTGGVLVQTVQQLVQENGKLAVMGKMARALAEPESLEKIWAKLAELMEQ